MPKEWSRIKKIFKIVPDTKVLNLCHTMELMDRIEQRERQESNVSENQLKQLMEKFRKRRKILHLVFRPRKGI